MAEETATAPDPVAAIPETAAAADTSADFSFEAALEQSIMGANEPKIAPEPNKETTTETEILTSETKPTVETETKTAEATEADTQTESTEAEPSADLLEALDADVSEGWTPKAANAFQRLKSELKERNTERETLTQRAREAEAKVAELEGVVGNETVETLQNRVREYEQAQMVSNLEATDAYHDAVIRPLEQVFMGVEKLAEAHGVDYQELVDAITIEDAYVQEEKVSELLATASDREKAMFYRLAAEVDPILQRRDALHANASEALREAELAADERSKMEAADRAANRHSVTKNVVQRIQDKVPFLSGFEDLNLETIQKEAADVDPSVIHAVDFAYQAVAARLMPSMVKEYAAAQKEIEQLTAQLATYEDAEPKLSGGTNSAPLAGSATSASGDFAASIEQALSGV